MISNFEFRITHNAKCQRSIIPSPFTGCVCVCTFNLFSHLEKNLFRFAKFNGHVIQFYCDAYWSHDSASADDILLEFPTIKQRQKNN